MPYEDIARRFEKLERRNTSYQFDLEGDIAWDRAADPGTYFPWEFVAGFGIDIEPLRKREDAAGLFQWAYALSICEAFIALEDIILTFVDAETKNLPPTRSLDLLCAEERKHVELFRRLSALLRAARPGATDAFDAAYAPTGAWFEERRRGVCLLAAEAGSERSTFQHFMFWLLTMFFEEFTIYLDDVLRAHDDIQPTWASAHSAHRREETQHVVTDLAYLDMVRVDDEARGEWSEMFVASLARGLPRFTAYDAAIATVEAVHPGLAIAPKVPLSTTPFFRAICTAPEFRRTRQHAVALARQSSVTSAR